MNKMGSFKAATDHLEDLGVKTPAFGIDLGTTNSCVAVVQSGTTPVVLTLKNGKKTMPSCILWKGKEGQFEVGQSAYNNRYKPYAVYSAKRHIGEDHEFELTYGRKTLKMTPVEVSAEVLKGLVEQATGQYKNIKDVVITVPAYFNSKQVKDTMEAGNLAGLNVLGILREPTAGVILYGEEESREGEETILVYDLGGGTFDVSVVRINKSETEHVDEDFASIYGLSEGEEKPSTRFTVLEVDGDSRLGGDDIDLELYKILERRMSSDLDINVDLIPRQEKEKIILGLEDVKKQGLGNYDMKLKFKLRDGSPVDERIEIKPSDFTDAARVIYRKTKEKVNSVIARVGKDTVTSIVLVGGSTKFEPIKSFLAKDFPNVRINDAFNPDESVALGAAINAKQLKFKDANVEVFDVIPMSIGVLADDRVRPLIKRGQRVPFRTSASFSTTVDNQDVVRVAIYEGVSTYVEECTYLGSLVIDGLPKKKAGEEKISVTLSIDSNGMLYCEVKTSKGTKSMELVNVFGRQEQKKTLTPKERRIAKWTAFAETLEGKARADVLMAISAYTADKLSEKVMTELIRKHSDREINVEKHKKDEPIYE